MAVVVPGELHDEAAAGEAAGEPDGAHRRLGAAGDQAHLLDRGRPGRRSPRRAAPRSRRACRTRSPGGRLAHGLEDLGVRVAEDHRPPAADQVDVVAAVDVGEPRTPPARHEPRGAPDGAEGPHRGVDPTGGHRPGARHQGCGGRSLGRGGLGGRGVDRHRPILPATAGARPGGVGRNRGRAAAVSSRGRAATGRAWWGRRHRRRGRPAWPRRAPRTGRASGCRRGAAARWPRAARRSRRSPPARRR